MYKQLLKPFFFQMDPEQVHHLMLEYLEFIGESPFMLQMLHAMYGVKPHPALRMNVCGLDFPSPVGLAAGLDKHGRAVPAFSHLGFGFMEAGTITPKPQPGNELPRLFRLPEDVALINRMGFNSEGTLQMLENLSQVKERPIPLAINIGKNKLTPNERAGEDYQICLRRLYSCGDFFVINISSPNTQDLRKLQFGDELSDLLTIIYDERHSITREQDIPEKPILIKIAPDLTDDELEQTLAIIMKHPVDGIVATNTTILREGLSHPSSSEIGGLSGKPLREKSTAIIRKTYRFTKGKLPIIGSGGIFSGADAYEKVKAGASLLEIYTSLIYEGPGALRKINAELLALLEQDGFKHLSEAIGIEAR